MHIYENEAYSPSSDYKIMINVSDEKSAVNGKQRNVVLGMFLFVFINFFISICNVQDNITI